jgi:hypothetical protein
VQCYKPGCELRLLVILGSPFAGSWIRPRNTPETERWRRDELTGTQDRMSSGRPPGGLAARARHRVVRTRTPPAKPPPQREALSETAGPRPPDQGRLSYVCILPGPGPSSSGPSHCPAPMPYAVPRPMSCGLWCPRTPAHNTRRNEHPLFGEPAPIGPARSGVSRLTWKRDSAKMNFRRTEFSEVRSKGGSTPVLQTLLAEGRLSGLRVDARPSRHRLRV